MSRLFNWRIWWQQPFFHLRDSVNKRLDAIEERLARIETLLTDHDRRISTSEERTSPLRR